jgi:hypothetical protein
MKESKKQIRERPCSKYMIPFQNRYALTLLGSWMTEPDNLGEAWWNEFECDLQENRFKLRTPED